MRRLVSGALAWGVLSAAGLARAEGAPPAPSGSAPSAGITGPGAKVVEIDLSRGAPESPSGGLFRAERSTYTDLVRALAELRADPKTKGILVRVGLSRLGWARTAEVARTLRALREDKKLVYCHADDVGNQTAWLFAEGCDRIFVSPAGGVDTVGIAAEMLFAKDLLAKFGVRADVLQVGKYKGTGEMLTRSTASDEVKQSVQGALSDIRTHWLSGVLTARPSASGLEAGPHTPEEAKKLGLVDEVAYFDEARDALFAKVGAKKTEPLLGHGSGGGLADLLRVFTGARRRKGMGQIAVLRASGAITMEKSRGLGGDDGIDARSLIRLAKQVEKDDLVKAVVLRIDSPGGSALASDLMWHQLMSLRKKKPLVVSVGDMAASGGYYLACAGTKIVAERTSIVGSIGVVGGKVALGPALEPYGVRVEPIPAVPGSDPSRAVYMSGLSPWDDATKARVLASMESIYDLFVKRVEEGRGLGKADVDRFAEGRIWSGAQGKSMGMVDELGGLSRAIEVARVEAKLDEGASIRVIEEQRGIFDVFDEEEDAAAAAVSEAVRPRLPEALIEAARFADAWSPLLGTERALVALPFGLLVR